MSFDARGAVRHPLARRWAVVAFAALAVHSSFARAGVDAWTTTGPRTTWSFHVQDPVVAGRIFLGLPGSKALYVSADGGATFVRSLTFATFSLGIGTTVTPSVTSIAVDPANPARLWVSNDWNVVHSSDDAGAHWTQALSITASAPWPSRVVVAPWASGDVFASVGGTLWRKLPSDTMFAPGVAVSDFALRSDRAGEVLLVDHNGLARSTDFGATWARVAGVPPGVYSLIVASPANPARFYVITEAEVGLPGNVHRSDDGGLSWTPLAQLPGFPRPVDVVPDASNADRLYVLTSSSAGRQLMRSDDAGAHFVTVDVPGGAPQAFGVARDGTLCLTNEVGLLCSSDQGTHWSAQETTLPGYGLDEPRLTSLWSDLVVARGQPGHAVSRMLGRSRVFGEGTWHDLYGPAMAGVGTDGTLQGVRPQTDAPDTLESSADGGTTWTILRSVAELQFNCVDLAVAPSDPSSMIRYGAKWGPRFNLLMPGCLGASRDGGATFTDLAATENADGAGAQVVRYDPNDANVVWMSRGAALKKSVDGGITWSSASVLPFPRRVRSISIDPADSRRMVVHSMADPGVPTAVYASENGGSTWNDVTGSLTFISATDVDWSGSPAQVYAATGKGIWRAPFGTTSWQVVGASADWNANDIRIVAPVSGSERTTAIAATSTGVWDYTLSSGLPFVPVFRFFNTSTGAHFYTASAAERDFVIATWPQFAYEGEKFRVLSAPVPGTLPVYRFFNTQTGVHFYTADEAEKDHVIATWPQFLFEGIAYYAFRSDPGTSPMHRFFNTRTGTHFYTTSEDERFTVQQNYSQFVYEGNRWAVYPSGRGGGAP